MTFEAQQFKDVQVYTALCKHDNTLSFQIQAFNEAHAKVQLLDKVGYAVYESPSGDFYLVDADNEEDVFCKLKTTSLVAACDEGVTAIGWTLTEPTTMIGGAMGSGFGLEERN